MINSYYFYQLFGHRTGYVYQYTGAATDHASITSEFCSAAEDHSISTIITEIEGTTVVLSPVTVEHENYQLVNTAEPAPEPLVYTPEETDAGNAAPESNPV